MARRSRADALSAEQRIEEFLRVTEELLSRRALQSGLGFSWMLKFDEGQFEQSGEGPDQEDYRSLWMDIRKLLSPGAATYLPTVLNAAWLVYGDSESQRWWQEIREAFKRTLGQGPIGCSVDGVSYSPGDLIDLWLNGELFHDDIEKRRLWRTISEPLPGIAELIINNAVISLLQIIAGTVARLDLLRGGSGRVVIGGASVL